MSRSTSEQLEELLPGCETQSTVEITLRDNTIVRFCTGDAELNLGGNPYDTLLMRIGELKEVLGQATNRVEGKVSNASGEFGLNVASPARLMELANVVIKRLFRDEMNPEISEWKHFFTGKAVNCVVAQQKSERTFVQFATFDVIPDTTAAGTCIATETLTPNNGWVFPEAPEQSAPGSGDNPDPSIPCFIGKTKFGFYDGSSIKFEELYQRRDEFIGQKAARSFDDENKPVRGEIKAVFRHLVYEYLKVTFEDGTVTGVTPEHPYFTEIGEYIAIRDLKAGDAVFDDSDEQRLVRIVSIEPVRIERGFWVYNAEILIYENYSADNKRVHNRKDNSNL